MHNDIIDTIRLDITKSSTNVCVYVRTGDTRTLEFFLTNNGNVVDLTGATFAAMYIDKNEEQYYQTVVVNGNKLRYTIHDAEVAEPGEASCRMVISFADETQITSPVFSMLVEEIPAMNSAVTNTGDYLDKDALKYTAIADALNAANEFAETCEEKSEKTEQLVTDAEQIFANIQELLQSTETLIDILNGIVPVTEEDVDAMWNGEYDPEAQAISDEEEEE